MSSSDLTFRILCYAEYNNDRCGKRIMKVEVEKGRILLYKKNRKVFAMHFNDDFIIDVWENKKMGFVIHTGEDFQVETRIQLSTSYDFARVLFALQAFKSERSYRKTCYFISTCLYGKDNATAELNLKDDNTFLRWHRSSLLLLFPNASIPVPPPAQDLSSGDLKCDRMDEKKESAIFYAYDKSSAFSDSDGSYESSLSSTISSKASSNGNWCFKPRRCEELLPHDDGDCDLQRFIDSGAVPIYELEPRNPAII